MQGYPRRCMREPPFDEACVSGRAWDTGRGWRVWELSDGPAGSYMHQVGSEGSKIHEDFRCIADEEKDASTKGS
ncbi:hypothetical protein EYF80_020904 [Liparis tanakae]|uniref:Uncharacterized protein n=1 Tax=Liparis tanakae TaxID=230148 RepID=A0A4Z2HSU6_9TELE|nr:hypothetical protein EYF80_020904 [Liparis tanakae]